MEFELTRRGKTVAVIVPIKEYGLLRAGRPSFAVAYRRFLETHSLGEVGIDEDFAASIRNNDTGRKTPL